MSSLPDDYYTHQENAYRLYGENTGKTFALGDELEVELIEVRPIAGGMIFKYIDKENLNYVSKENSVKKRGGGFPKRYKKKRR
jgi:ribonuclease R